MSKKEKAWAADDCESWGGYMAAKKAKLEEQFHEEVQAEFQDISSLFQGVAIFVNGYTDPVADELRRLMMMHGGVYHHYLRPRQTTHMIASNLPYSKIVMYMKSKNPLPLCKPSWITDSIKAGKLLDFRKYLLYSQCTKTQPHLLNIFKSTTKSSENSSTLDDSKSLKVSSLLQNDPQSPRVLNKNSTVSKSPLSSTSKNTPLNISGNRFPSEKSFLKKESIHKSSGTSTLKNGHKNPVSIISSRVESPNLKISIRKPKESPEFNKSNDDYINKSNDDYINKSSGISTPKNGHKNPVSIISSRVESPNLKISISKPKESPELNKSNEDSLHKSSRTSTPKTSHKNSVRLNSSRVESPNLKISITKPKESPELNKSNEKNAPEVPKPPVDNASSAGTSDKNKSKSSYSNCSKNSDFISEFYNNSRLHHIATMGATFKDYINELREKNSGNFSGLDRLILDSKHNRPGPSTRHDSDSEEDIFAFDSSPSEILPENVIMHIDMDCFFVSVGIRNRPELKGLPVAVTHAKGNKQSSNSDGNQEGSYSEIASCSYEARKLGLKNGMFLGQALKLCPNLKTIKYDFEGYKEVSYALYDTVASYTLDIEAVSCDEMYADISKILQKTGLTPLEFADALRKEIKTKTGCPVSTGFGSNKLQARLATKKAKPDGKYYLKAEAVLNYIGTLSVKDLPGVGYSTTSKLNLMNVRTCSELQTVGLPVLQKEFGKKTGELLYNMCRGIDNSKLSLEHVRKSISAEVNYGIRFENHAEAEEFLRKLSAEVCTRLKKAKAKGRCITLKLMVRAKEAPKEAVKFMGHGHCDYFTRSKNCIAAVDELSIITKEILTLWNQAQQLPDEIRGIGIQISRLEILKHKSNTGGLMNFINKAKQANFEGNAETSNKPNENIDSKNQNSPSILNSGANEQLNSKITDFKTLPKKTNSSFFSNDKLILPSHDIDDSVLNELPEDIRNEILASTNIKSKSENQKKGSSDSSKSIQTKQESYFKEKKPNVPKGKAILPPMQEIDMAVLVELPEDIRNEILNEYKTKSEEFGSPSKKVEHASDKEAAIELDQAREAEPDQSNSRLSHLRDEKDFSYSQVDPEFLAALPEDMRDDVQMYCMMKKREKNNAEKKKPTEAKPKGISDGWSMFKQSTSSKIVKPKSTRGRKPKSILGRNSGVATRVKEVDRGQNKAEVTKQVSKEVEKEAEIKANEEKETAEIISHLRLFPAKVLKSGGQEKALSSIVKCMFDLSLDQVKVQIQNWVCNSETVNEIDILSLATYLSMLPRRRQIEDLHVIFKCMHRCITKSESCVWHETYRKIVEHVQHFMQIEYNSDLMVPSIGCNLHKCRGADVR
ncbi:DNA repair protein REV1 [Belonocnema kinseyi]|uniref:DNA repair protein REV1 n=1 Tax=Belonocnema kinseyi TaxID=2817044 RepID=UPI00143D4A04|nr:DNA repair protein REV1 [Belonocnema kinseyi]XP_033208205.1 DNA repair protein REV1 [Belonocnema kinseyi]